MSPRSETYEKELRRLVTLLRRQAFTALELAERLGCPKQTIFNRLAALEARGYALRRIQARSGKRGPLAVAFEVAALPE